MSQKSKIEWTDATWNPVRGCTRVSEGCRNCYAERMAARGLPAMNSPTTGKPFASYPIEHGKRSDSPRWTGKVELIESQLELPLHWRKPRRIFVNSMSDLFHQSLHWMDRKRVFDTMQLADWHTYQILTKRGEIMRDFGSAWVEQFGPMPQNWRFGVSCEDQKTADERIPLLLQTPATVRFVSLEPLLEDTGVLDLRGIHQVIVGGESGPGARPMHPDWVRSITDQCLTAGVPFFFKQWGEWSPIKPDGYVRLSSRICGWSFPSQMVYRVGKKAAGRELDGCTWEEEPDAVASVAATVE
jgi:protein gp37